MEPVPPTPDAPRPLHRRVPVGWLVVAVLVALALGAVPRVRTWWALLDDHAAAVSAHLARADRALAAVPPLTPAENAALRRHTNAAHVRLGRRLGAAPVVAAETLVATAVRRGLRLLPADTTHYVAWRGTYSAPYLTPDAKAALDSVGAAFAARLGALGLPSFRFTVSSALRSRDGQGALRGVNANAARGETSHAFGTTFDLPYRRFSFGSFGVAAPPPPPAALPGFLRAYAAARADATARAHFAAVALHQTAPLDAVLGRALLDLQRRGVLVALRETGQPVYHTTVARPLATE